MTVRRRIATNRIRETGLSILLTNKKDKIDVVIDGTGQRVLGEGE